MLLEITLPGNTDLLIKPGDSVDFSTPLYTKSVQEDVKIPLSSILKINAKKIFTVLKKFVGEEVKKGDIIAFRTGLFASRQYVSEHDGIIREVNHTEGYLIIQSATDETQKRTAWFCGTVKEIIPSSRTDQPKVVLDVSKKHSMDARLTTHNVGGELSIIADETAAATLTEESIAQKIIFAPTLRGFEQAKIEALAAAGTVTAHPLTVETTFPHAVLANPDEFTPQKWESFSYCTVDHLAGKIHIYA